MKTAPQGAVFFIAKPIYCDKSLSGESDKRIAKVNDDNFERNFRPPAV